MPDIYKSREPASVHFQSDVKFDVAPRIESAGVAASTVQARETISPFRQLTITLEDEAIALTDEAGVVAYGSKKLWDFEAGYIRILGAVADLTVTKSAAGVNNNFDGDFGLGTVAAGNNNALATTEQNIIPTTATPQAVGGATTAKGVSTNTEHEVIHDGHTTPIDLYLNVLVDDDDHDVGATPTNLVVNGTIIISYINIGDN